MDSRTLRSDPEGRTKAMIFKRILAVALDRAGEGLVSVNQQPMIDLYKNLSARQ